VSWIAAAATTTCVVINTTERNMHRETLSQEDAPSDAMFPAKERENSNNTKRQNSTT
jgi:hypothetical protein